MNKTWGACKIFLKKYYELNKCYSNARPGRMGVESATNMADKIEMESDKLKNYLDGLSDATRADKEQMNQMALTNKAIVELCQQLTEAKIQQGKQITELILQVAKLTKLLTEKNTKPAGSDRSERTAAAGTKNVTRARKSTRRERSGRIGLIR